MGQKNLKLRGSFWKIFRWVLLGFLTIIVCFVIYYFSQRPAREDEIPRIPLQVCPDKEFEGQGDGVLYLNGKKYYTEIDDWEWIVQNCPDYTRYK